MKAFNFKKLSFVVILSVLFLNCFAIDIRYVDEGSYSFVSLSPDGETIAVVNEIGDLILFNALTMQKIKVLNVYHNSKDRAEYVTFSPKGNYIASATMWGEIIIWDAKSGTEIKRIEKDVEYMTFSPDEKYLACVVSGRRGIILWDFFKDEKIYDIVKVKQTKPKYYHRSRFGSSVRRINLMRHACVFRPLLRRYYFKGVRYGVPVFTPDGKRFAVANNKGKIGVWDVETGEKIETIKAHDKHVENIAFSRNGKYLAVAADDCVRLWTTDKWEVMKLRQKHSVEVERVSFDTDNNIVSASCSEIIKGSMNGDVIEVIPINQKGYFQSCFFSVDSEMFIFTNMYQELGVIDL